jgi:hypothetical protein
MVMPFHVTIGNNSEILLHVLPILSLRYASMTIRVLIRRDNSDEPTAYSVDLKQMTQPGKATVMLKTWNCIRGALGSNVGRDIGCPDCGVS